MAHDLRGEELSNLVLRELPYMHGLEFQWTRFIAEYEDDHEHCRICWAHMCDAKDRWLKRFPDANVAMDPDGQGHYRHGYRAIPDHGSPVWVCRSCFKRVAPLANWSVKPRPKPVPR